MRRQNATAKIPVNLLNELGDSGMKIMTALVKKIYGLAEGFPR